ncbi:MAG: hypothetical protein ACRDWI_17645 [Jiangellaceae bacterium]
MPGQDEQHGHRDGADGRSPRHRGHLQAGAEAGRPRRRRCAGDDIDHEHTDRKAGSDTGGQRASSHRDLLPAADLDLVARGEPERTEDRDLTPAGGRQDCRGGGSARCNEDDARDGRDPERHRALPRQRVADEVGLDACPFEDHDVRPAQLGSRCGNLRASTRSGLYPDLVGPR